MNKKINYKFDFINKLQKAEELENQVYNSPKKRKKNQGIITIPFLLVIVIILFFTLAFLMLSMTFVHVTVTQYLTYSSARKLSLGGIDSVERLEAARNQYKNLRAQFFNPNAHSGQPGDWFFIQKELDEGTDDTEQENAVQGDYPESNNIVDRFYGINTGFKSQILNLNIPFLIENEDDQINNLVRVSSFLGREPSEQECKDFHETRVEQMLKKMKDACQSDCSNLKAPEILCNDEGCGDNKC